MKKNSKGRSLLAVALFIIGLAILDDTSIRAQETAGTDSAEVQISNLRFFEEPLVWVGKTAPTSAETSALLKTLLEAKAQPMATRVDPLENFISANPNSPWTPSLRANVGYFYFTQGRYTKALEHWSAAWNATQDFDSGMGKVVADYTLVHWSGLLSAFCQINDLEQLFAATKDRRMERRQWQEAWIQSHNDLVLMEEHPEVAYRCGAVALAQLARALGTPVNAEFWKQFPSPGTGFSMSSLVEMAGRHNLDLLPVRRGSSQELIIPCVVHLRHDHYAAITQQRNGLYLVVDPSLKSHWLTPDAINEEASGNFLVPRSKNLADWQVLTKDDTDSVFGKGWNTQNPPDPPPPCPGPDGSETCNAGCNPPGPGGELTSCRGCSGMPTWDVTEPYISLLLQDKPMSYQTSRDKEFAIQLYYQQRETRPISTNVFNFGQSWSFDWLSFIDVTDSTGDTNYPCYSATLYGSGGGQRTYTYSDFTRDYYNQTTLSRILDGNGNLTGFKQSYPNGSVAVYGYLQTISSGPEKVRAFLTARTDPQGRTSRLVYQITNNVVLLTGIVDCDGLTNTLRYNNISYPAQVTEIDNPYGDKVQIGYGSNGMLTNLVDVVGISTIFTYSNIDTLLLLTKMTTPYGTTRFDYTTPTADLFGDDKINRAITVTQPDGGHHVYAYRDSTSFLDVSGMILPMIDSQVVPLYNAGLCNSYMTYRNTYYWGPRQYGLLSTTNLTGLTDHDYLLARMRNWLHSVDMLSVGRTLNMHREPSPDGVTEGQKTWYGYVGKSDYVEGTNMYQPAVEAWILPNGETHFTYKVYNEMGRPTTEISTYSSPQGVAFRTNTYSYAANGTDLLVETGPDGFQNSFGYNTNHQVLFWTNKVGDIISYTYNTDQEVTSVALPTGLITTNIYQNGWLITTYDYSTTGTYFRTNTYTYNKGLVKTHADERGLTVTNYYDALARLTGIGYPDSTTTSNLYTVATTYPNGSGGLMILDRTASKDRLGKWSYYTYDSMRRVTSETDPLGNSTIYEYCVCGSLETILDALANKTEFGYDSAGRRTSVTNADNGTIRYYYDLFGQVTNLTDSAGMSVTNWYNNQGLLYASSNAFGQMFLRNYDVNDRVTNSVDQNGAVTITTFDPLGRVLSRTAPYGGTEVFGYSPAGLIGYTNQLGYTTYYGYDAVRRKIAETNANNQITCYGYNAAGDLLSLKDGNNNMTQWGYDLYGRVTNKVDAAATTIIKYQYDANGRLTNRLSAAKGNTQYTYDNVGNLKTLQYSNGVIFTYAYDALNRVTNMTDGVGTSSFTYDSMGRPKTEGGLWVNDSVSYVYTNGRLASLSFLATQQGGGTTALNHSYGYDGANRLKTIVSSAGTFTYTYNAGFGGNVSSSALVGNLVLGNGAFVTNTFDDVGRLISTLLESSANSALAYEGYGYNVANQRTNVVRRGDSISSTAYNYDPIGQLTADVASETSGTPRLNEQRGYNYDAAGNLKYRTNNALVQYFGVNSLNELTTTTNGGRLTVAGSISSQASSVTVNATNAILYTDNTFAATNMPNASTYTAIAQDASGRQANAAINVNLPISENYQYDGNGNLLSDGSRTFTYDCENQLISVIGTNGTPWKSDFAYDGKMRRRVRTEATWNGSAWVTNQIVRYIYSGNLVVQERDGNNVAQATYIRGKDLSGSWGRVGGIGGLLARIDTSSTNYYHSDGNGNITAMIDGKQTVVARYQYDAFGNLVGKSGSFADTNLYRFSSKEWHPNSGLVYYLYRYYDPNLQRWLNRDPLGELLIVRLAGRKPRRADPWEAYEGLNSYSYVHNNSVNFVDPNGEISIAIIVTAILIVIIAWPHPQPPYVPPRPPPPPPPPSCPVPAAPGQPDPDGPEPDPGHNPAQQHPPGEPFPQPPAEDPPLPGDGPWSRPGNWWQEGEGPFEAP